VLLSGKGKKEGKGGKRTKGQRPKSFIFVCLQASIKKKFQLVGSNSSKRKKIWVGVEFVVVVVVRTYIIVVVLHLA
jgi:hypothetical protein